MAQPYVNNDELCFAYKSLHTRWPAIVDGVIADLEHAASTAPEAGAAEAPRLVAAIHAIKDQMHDDAELGTFPSALTNGDVFNAATPAGTKWHSAPWLLSECVLYRRLQEVFDESSHWKQYDMFQRQKNETFVKSADAVSNLAHRYEAITAQLAGAAVEPAVLEVLVHELLSTSLWGNATDLSLLVTVSLEELKKLQVAAENRDKESLLVNDFPKVWKQLQSQRGGRVDIVLDNSGFELYTDLVLALFLLDTGLADQVVMHPKSQPWFVSDVVPTDFGAVLGMLGDATKFPAHRESLDKIVEQLVGYMSEGQLLIRTSPFWTTPLPYWEIKENGKGGGDALWRDLKQSKLVILKGDLNYRKLTGDLAWARTTPFATAVQDLASSQVPLVTLRTVKADVCVGLPEGKAEELGAKWIEQHPHDLPNAWSWSGHFAVVNFLSGR